MRTHLRLTLAGLAAAAATVLLAGCNATSQPSAVRAEGVEDIGVTAFREICLQSAPSFAEAPGYARKYGVDLSLALGEEKMGMTADHSLSVQVKPGAECAITTPNRPDDAAVGQFRKVVAEATRSPVMQLPFVAAVRGVTFIFNEDRKGGEAYVMTKKE
jgi:hypothetical protein